MSDSYSLALRMVSVMADMTKDNPRQWVQLSELTPRLGASWQQAQDAAELAASHGWVRYFQSCVLLRDRSGLDAPH
jgi:hypothetical protein